MNIDDTVPEGLHDGDRYPLHVSGEGDEIDPVFVEAGKECLVERFVRIELFSAEVKRWDGARPCDCQRTGIRIIAYHERNLGIWYGARVDCVQNCLQI